jgi:hypothetical protein
VAPGVIPPLPPRADRGSPATPSPHRAATN